MKVCRKMRDSTIQKISVIPVFSSDCVSSSIVGSMD